MRVFKSFYKNISKLHVEAADRKSANLQIVKSVKHKINRPGLKTKLVELLSGIDSGIGSYKLMYMWYQNGSRYGNECMRSSFYWPEGFYRCPECDELVKYLINRNSSQKRRCFEVLFRKKKFRLENCRICRHHFFLTMIQTLLRWQL
jgi:hypothetical protein